MPPLFVVPDFFRPEAQHPAPPGRLHRDAVSPWRSAMTSGRTATAGRQSPCRRGVHRPRCRRRIRLAARVRDRRHRVRPTASFRDWERRGGGRFQPHTEIIERASTATTRSSRWLLHARV